MVLKLFFRFAKAYYHYSRLINKGLESMRERVREGERQTDRQTDAEAETEREEKQLSPGRK